MMANWKVKTDEEKDFSEKSLTQKRDILRALAQQPELEDILDVMANEAIVYDDNETYICDPFIDTGVIQDLNEQSSEEIKNAMNTAFYKLYLQLRWKQHAWDIFKRWLRCNKILSYLSIMVVNSSIIHTSPPLYVYKTLVHHIVAQPCSQTP